MTTTHRERIKACINGEMTDRTPVALWRHFPEEDQNPETLAAATLKFQQAYDFDIVKVTPASSFAVKDWGVEDEWQNNPEGSRAYTKQGSFKNHNSGKCSNRLTPLLRTSGLPS